MWPSDNSWLIFCQDTYVSKFINYKFIKISTKNL